MQNNTTSHTTSYLIHRTRLALTRMQLLERATQEQLSVDKALLELIEFILVSIVTEPESLFEAAVFDALDDYLRSTEQTIGNITGEEGGSE